MNHNEGNNTQEVVEVTVDIQARFVDAVRDFITEHICLGKGLEEQDQEESTRFIFYVAPSRLAGSKKQILEYLEGLTGNTTTLLPEITHHVLKKSDWEEQYRRSVQPVRVTDEILARPPWTDPDADVLFDIIIEPKMAFGTGRHETTCSCLKTIRNRFKTGMRFLDVGTGSGILSILADKLNAGYIKAVDIDPDAVSNCQENFAVNRVTAPHDIELGSVEKCDGDVPYDFICANISKDIIVEMIPVFNTLLADNGLLVLSGLLDGDVAEVSVALKESSLTTIDIIAEHEWRAMVTTRM